ncbi:hypothetical protein NFI96_030145 [Prochilodus magdalenae]|nr:hypothetical protein NFI96_030145 [Prochilodus magdalenae]
MTGVQRDWCVSSGGGTGVCPQAAGLVDLLGRRDWRVSSGGGTGGCPRAAGLAGVLDPTFDLGDFCVSPLLFCHQDFKQCPIAPSAEMILRGCNIGNDLISESTLEHVNFPQDVLTLKEHQRHQSGSLLLLLDLGQSVIEEAAGLWDRGLCQWWALGHSNGAGRRLDPAVKILKFADDSTLVGLIANGDESAYRKETEQLVSWCSNNHLLLNTEKTVEMVVDFRRSPPPLPPPPHQHCSIHGGVTQTLMIQFYTAIVKSILTTSITIWFGSSTSQERTKLQRIIRTAERIIGCNLPSLQQIYTSRVRKRAGKITSDPSHPGHLLFQTLPSGRRTAAQSTQSSGTPRGRPVEDGSSRSRLGQKQSPFNRTLQRNQDVASTRSAHLTTESWTGQASIYCQTPGHVTRGRSA